MIIILMSVGPCSWIIISACECSPFVAGCCGDHFCHSLYLLRSFLHLWCWFQKTCFPCPFIFLIELIVVSLLIHSYFWTVSLSSVAAAVSLYCFLDLRFNYFYFPADLIGWLLNYLIISFWNYFCKSILAPVPFNWPCLLVNDSSARLILRIFS